MLLVMARLRSVLKVLLKDSTTSPTKANLREARRRKTETGQSLHAMFREVPEERTLGTKVLVGRLFKPRDLTVK